MAYYTRDETAEVLDGHSRWVDNGFFTVRTRLDNLDREIITDCFFAYYSYGKEEQKENIEYHDIDGCVYCYVELNEERTHAIVTYLVGDEEKQFVVELPVEE